MRTDTAARTSLFVAALLAISAATTLGQVQPSPLRGVTKVTVEVSVSGADCTPNLEANRLRTVVELRLRTAGLRVLTAAEDRADPDINPEVTLTIICMQATTAAGPIGYAFSTRVATRIWQRVTMNGTLAPSELWANSYLNVIDLRNLSQEGERIVGVLLDELLNEWLKANPRR